MNLHEQSFIHTITFMLTSYFFSVFFFVYKLRVRGKEKKWKKKKNRFIMNCVLKGGLRTRNDIMAYWLIFYIFLQFECNPHKAISILFPFLSLAFFLKVIRNAFIYSWLEVIKAEKWVIFALVVDFNEGFYESFLPFKDIRSLPHWTMSSPQLCFYEFLRVNHLHNKRRLRGIIGISAVEALKWIPNEINI